MEASSPMPKPARTRSSRGTVVTVVGRHVRSKHRGHAALKRRVSEIAGGHGRIITTRSASRDPFQGDPFLCKS